jgi:diacylglycerol O-acyltransferase / wax synthase
MADRLTALDSSFLHLEDASSHMHVASVTIFEGPPPSHQELMDHIERRLELVPRFRQKLRFVPLNQGRPVWVDDPHFNLDYHVRTTALPPPGDEEQLKRLAGRVFSQQLDRSKPLWEIWLVHGMDRGMGDDDGEGRFALLSKTHHALVDGVAGVDITAVLFDTAAEPQTQPAVGPPWVARPEPTSAQLFGEALLERITQPAEIVRTARAAFRAPRMIAKAVYESAGAVGALAKSGLGAPPSSLNVDIGPHRRFEWSRTDLATLKGIKNELGGSVNDVVLAVVAGALRRFLQDRGEEDVSELELRVMVPVSVRREDEHGIGGNRVAAMMAPLPVYEADPVERLRIVREAMSGLKEGKQAVGAQILTELSGFAPPTVLAQAGRLQARQRFFNLVVTNVPGPQSELFVLGRRLIDLFPMAPLAKRQALCIAVMSYNGKLNFGLLGDYDEMPDLENLARSIQYSLDELRVAAGVEAAVAETAPLPEAARTTAATQSNGAAETSSVE